uniref:Uncharacterized protein n=1 Tax=Triticum urartu TaxID=4572 RepID=A0A8R7K0N1_TRIUA
TIACHQQPPDPEPRRRIILATPSRVPSRRATRAPLPEAAVFKRPRPKPVFPDDPFAPPLSFPSFLLWSFSLCSSLSPRFPAGTKQSCLLLNHHGVRGLLVRPPLPPWTAAVQGPCRRALLLPPPQGDAPPRASVQQGPPSEVHHRRRSPPLAAMSDASWSSLHRAPASAPRAWIRSPSLRPRGIRRDPVARSPAATTPSASCRHGADVVFCSEMQ